MDKSVQITLIVVLGVLLLTGMGFMYVNSKNPTSSDVVSATGQSTIKAMPDLVTVYFNIESTAATSKEANDKNAKIVEDLKVALLKKGIANDKVITDNFNIYPEYNWDSGTQTIKNYKATHSIKVELAASNSGKIGDVIDAGADSGALISYINFELTPENQNKVKAEALKAATEDAKIKASAIAEGLGKKIGSVVSVTNNEFYYQPWNLYTAKDSMAGSANVAEARHATTSIQPGNQDISASVSATFKLR